VGTALKTKHMMEFRVVITAPADRDFRDHWEWIRERSVQGADNWRARIISSIRALQKNPAQHAPARESGAFPVTIRCLLVGKRRSAFRILFHIADDEVRILAIRRPAQDFLSPDDLDEQ
jgi:plasmid stabilization system protein ParE